MKKIIRLAILVATFVSCTPEEQPVVTDPRDQFVGSYLHDMSGTVRADGCVFDLEGFYDDFDFNSTNSNLSILSTSVDGLIVATGKWGTMKGTVSGGKIQFESTEEEFTYARFSAKGIKKYSHGPATLSGGYLRWKSTVSIEIYNKNETNIIMKGTGEVENVALKL